MGISGTLNSPNFIVVVTSQMKTFAVVCAVAQNNMRASFDRQKHDSSGLTVFSLFPSGLRNTYLIFANLPSALSASVTSSFSVKNTCTELH